MGHYDDCYEASAREFEKEQQTEYLTSIRKKIKKLSSSELKMVDDLIDHLEVIEGLISMFETLNRK